MWLLFFGLSVPFAHMLIFCRPFPLFPLSLCVLAFLCHVKETHARRVGEQSCLPGTEQCLNDTVHVSLQCHNCYDGFVPDVE